MPLANAWTDDVVEVRTPGANAAAEATVAAKTASFMVGMEGLLIGCLRSYSRITQYFAPGVAMHRSPIWYLVVSIPFTYGV